MNHSKYAGCRVEFVLWKTKHAERGEYRETDCGTECMDDSPLTIDPDKEFEVTEVFEEE